MAKDDDFLALASDGVGTDGTAPDADTVDGFAAQDDTVDGATPDADTIDGFKSGNDEITETAGREADETPADTETDTTQTITPSKADTMAEQASENASASDGGAAAGDQTAENASVTGDYSAVQKGISGVQDGIKGAISGIGNFASMVTKGVAKRLGIPARAVSFLLAIALGSSTLSFFDGSMDSQSLQQTAQAPEMKTLVDHYNEQEAYYDPDVDYHFLGTNISETDTVVAHAKEIFCYLRSLGYTQESIAGILSNMEAETRLLPDYYTGKEISLQTKSFDRIENASNDRIAMMKYYDENWNKYTQSMYTVYAREGVDAISSTNGVSFVARTKGILQAKHDVQPEDSIYAIAADDGSFTYMPGYGLFQFAGNRAKDMVHFANCQAEPADDDFDYINDHWQDVGLQIAYFYFENKKGLFDDKVFTNDWGKTDYYGYDVNYNPTASTDPTKAADRTKEKKLASFKMDTYKEHPTESWYTDPNNWDIHYCLHSLSSNKNVVYQYFTLLVKEQYAGPIPEGASLQDVEEGYVDSEGIFYPTMTTYDENIKKSFYLYDPAIRVNGNVYKGSLEKNGNARTGTFLSDEILDEWIAVPDEWISPTTDPVGPVDPNLIKDPDLLKASAHATVSPFGSSLMDAISINKDAVLPDPYFYPASGFVDVFDCADSHQPNTRDPDPTYPLRDGIRKHEVQEIHYVLTYKPVIYTFVVDQHQLGDLTIDDTNYFENEYIKKLDAQLNGTEPIDGEGTLIRSAQEAIRYIRSTFPSSFAEYDDFTLKTGGIVGTNGTQQALPTGAETGYTNDGKTFFTEDEILAKLGIDAIDESVALANGYYPAIKASDLVMPGTYGIVSDLGNPLDAQMAFTPVQIEIGTRSAADGSGTESYVVRTVGSGETGGTSSADYAGKITTTSYWVWNCQFDEHDDDYLYHLPVPKDADGNDVSETLHGLYIAWQNAVAVYNKGIADNKTLGKLVGKYNYADNIYSVGNTVYDWITDNVLPYGDDSAGIRTNICWNGNSKLQEQINSLRSAIRSDFTDYDTSYGVKCNYTYSDAKGDFGVPDVNSNDVYFYASAGVCNLWYGDAFFEQYLRDMINDTSWCYTNYTKSEYFRNELTGRNCTWDEGIPLSDIQDDIDKVSYASDKAVYGVDKDGNVVTNDSLRQKVYDAYSAFWSYYEGDYQKYWKEFNDDKDAHGPDNCNIDYKASYLLDDAGNKVYNALRDTFPAISVLGEDFYDNHDEGSLVEKRDDVKCIEQPDLERGFDTYWYQLDEDIPIDKFTSVSGIRGDANVGMPSGYLDKNPDGLEYYDTSTRKEIRFGKYKHRYHIYWKDNDYSGVTTNMTDVYSAPGVLADPENPTNPTYPDGFDASHLPDGWYMNLHGDAGETNGYEGYLMYAATEVEEVYKSATQFEIVDWYQDGEDLAFENAIWFYENWLEYDHVDDPYGVYRGIATSKGDNDDFFVDHVKRARYWYSLIINQEWDNYLNDYEFVVDEKDTTKTKLLQRKRKARYKEELDGYMPKDESGTPIYKDNSDKNIEDMYADKAFTETEMLALRAGRAYERYLTGANVFDNSSIATTAVSLSYAYGHKGYDVDDAIIGSPGTVWSDYNVKQDKTYCHSEKTIPEIMLDGKDASKQVMFPAMRKCTSMYVVVRNVMRWISYDLERNSKYIQVDDYSDKMAYTDEISALATVVRASGADDTFPTTLPALHEYFGMYDSDKKYVYRKDIIDANLQSNLSKLQYALVAQYVQEASELRKNDDETEHRAIKSVQDLIADTVAKYDPDIDMEMITGGAGKWVCKGPLYESHMTTAGEVAVTMQPAWLKPGDICVNSKHAFVYVGNVGTAKFFNYREFSGSDYAICFADPDYLTEEESYKRYTGDTTDYGNAFKDMYAAYVAANGKVPDLHGFEATGLVCASQNYKDDGGIMIDNFIKEAGTEDRYVVFRNVNHERGVSIYKSRLADYNFTEYNSGTSDVTVKWGSSSAGALWTKGIEEHVSEMEEEATEAPAGGTP